VINCAQGRCMHGLIEIQAGSKIIVIFTINENFQKFPADTKFPENLQPYTRDTQETCTRKMAFGD